MCAFVSSNLKLLWPPNISSITVSWENCLDDFPTSWYLSHLNKMKLNVKIQHLCLYRFSIHQIQETSQIQNYGLWRDFNTDFRNSEVGKGLYLRRKWVVILGTYHSVHGEQLVSSFESSMSFSHPSRNDARDVNWGILLLSSHHVKTKAFIRLWQFHYARVRVAFASCKSCDCCLKEKTVFW